MHLLPSLRSFMPDAMRTAAPTKSKPKAPAPKRSTRNIPATEKNKAPVPEADIDDEPLVLKKLRPKLPDHDDTHPIVEDMKARRDNGLRK